MTVITRTGQQQTTEGQSSVTQQEREIFNNTSSGTNTSPSPSSSSSATILTSASASENNASSPGKEKNEELSLVTSHQSHGHQEDVSVDVNSEVPCHQKVTESGDIECASDEEMMDGEEPAFPIHELNKLDDMINKPRWVIPVLPKGELEILLDATIDLCKRGLDDRSEACQRFIREGLTTSFTKILTDEAVSGWKFEIHRCIMHNCELLIELAVLKMHQDNLILLDLLSMVFTPSNKFHSFTSSRTETIAPSRTPDEEIFAKSPDNRTPRGWLVELINKFGKLGGFQLLTDRFQQEPALNVALIAALLKPFGVCYELLTSQTVEKYFLPIIKTVPSFLENLTDEELKKEAKNEAKNDALSGIVKALKCLASRIADQDETIKSLEMFRMKSILRLLQISSFNGKMNALNEVNKVITSVSYYSHRHPGGSGIGGIDEEEWLTAEKMAQWLKENKVLQIVLRDSLHQPQYVEKLEKIIRFIIKEKALTLDDLDDIWAAQCGKHEAIVKNVHDLLAKLAWDFSPEQLDHLFECFRTSWANATKKQREKLLELIRRLAEDDKDGVMAHKVLNLLWNLAHSDDVPNDIMDQALAAHVKILDYSCSQDRDAQKTEWLDRCVEELTKPNGGYWVLPALKQIREICCLYNEAPPNFVGPSASHQQPNSVTYHQRVTQLVYRHEIISTLQNQHSLVVLVSENLSQYMNRVRSMVKEGKYMNPHEIHPGSRFSHVQEVQERLNFLRFLLKDGQLWLCSPQAKQIWKCLAECAIYEEDREASFRWFSQLMSDEPDLDPEINRHFFEHNILQLDPSFVNESGMECFDRFFKAVNLKEGKLIAKRRGYQMEDYELIGVDYLWRVILHGNDEVASKAIDLLKDTFTNLGPKLQSAQVDIHEDFITSCIDRLKASYDTITIIEKDITAETRVRQELVKMSRVLNVLYEYVNQCDIEFGEERTILPMSRSFRGKNLLLIIRFPNHGRHLDDIEIWTHTNDTMHSVRQQILNKIKVNNANMKVDLYINGDLLDPSDKKLVMQLPLKDKMLLSAKLYQVNSNMPSSPDSSSDSSSSSPHHQFIGPNLEAESCLPGVIMSKQPQYAQFFFQLADIGMSLNYASLRESALALLKIMPADVQLIEHIKTLCICDPNKTREEQLALFDSEFFGSSPTRVVYVLGIVYSLIIPASTHLLEDAQEFQCNFMRSGCGLKILELLTKNNFLSKADDFSKICGYLIVLKISKLTLTTIAHSQILNDNMQSTKSLVALKDAIQCVPNPSSECMTRNIASRIAHVLCFEEKGKPSNIVLNFRPTKATTHAVMLLAYSAATGKDNALNASIEKLHEMVNEVVQIESSFEIYQMCKEALEVLTVMFMLSPDILDSLIKENTWQTFVIDLLLICKEKSIRATISEQFALIATKCAIGQDFLIKFIQLLHLHLNNSLPTNYQLSQEFFQLFCRLLNNASLTKCSLPNAKELLKFEIDLLRNVRKALVIDGLIEEIQLEGHLGITKELVSLLNVDEKYDVGCDPNGTWSSGKRGMIKILIEDYIFPASKAMVLILQQKNSRAHIEEMNPICSSPATLTAAYDLLVSLCTGSIQNLKLTSDTLIEMYYSNNEQLIEWEYFPPIGPRPARGFVGLKNAGATCYMNSVLQQLYMIPEIRDGILAVEGAALDPNEDFSGEEKIDSLTLVSNVQDQQKNEKEDEKVPNDCVRKEYNLGVLKQVQAIFGHLALSKCQYYVPKGFWRHFKLWGEPVNLREQHDALEFFNSLVDSIDESLKVLNHKPIMSTVLGGTFADQKICKNCPHRYSREESFTTLNIDIRNHSNLLDSLEQYVKGDLLEGANAYHCEKCNRKVDTVKRLCIKKLPTMLAIQLKRFDYDWERESAIKFNDYFEFPRLLDMEPYTVRGLAKIEGEIIDDDLTVCDDGIEVCTKYELCGIVVHSGQASGGHYYSYILFKNNDGSKKWYKFDDGDVSECKLDDDEEMRAQCYGGEYMGEVFDHMLKRMSCRRQKRWWNAYILFYRRLDTEETQLAKRLNELVLMDSKNSESKLIKMPTAIERSVQRQNIKFMHTKNQFSFEYFLFMKKLINCNAGNGNLTHQAYARDITYSKFQLELSSISTHLASKFLFSTCFRTKKALRGPAVEWYDILSLHLRVNESIRTWFAKNVLLQFPHRFCEYLLECPSNDVRSAFAKTIVFLAHFSLQDETQLDENISSQYFNSLSKLSDCLLHFAIELLKKEVSEYSRNLAQYFGLFCMYSTIGPAERTQLLRLNVPTLFMSVALDEGPGPPIKYQYADLSKLYQVVSLLVRCCDVSSKAMTCNQPSNVPPLPNPFIAEDCSQYLMPIQPQVEEMLFNKNNYIKKIIEEANTAEDTLKLLKFCCWENPNVSCVVLNELLWQIAYSYAYELRPHLDLLLHILLMEDSWQNLRIHNALKGGHEDREALFETIHRNKTHYQKRAYQCIKCLVTLFTTCPLALHILNSQIEYRRKWTSAVSWLNEELERGPYQAGGQYGYTNWSPPAQSNETSNGYYLERSNSARMTLTKACELCPTEDSSEEIEEHEMSEDTDSPPPESSSSTRNAADPPFTEMENKSVTARQFSEVFTMSPTLYKNNGNESFDATSSSGFDGKSKKNIKVNVLHSERGESNTNERSNPTSTVADQSGDPVTSTSPTLSSNKKSPFERYSLSEPSEPTPLWNTQWNPGMNVNVSVSTTPVVTQQPTPSSKVMSSQEKSDKSKDDQNSDS